MLPKIINLVKTYQSDIVLAICMIMLTVISFNLGKISASDSSVKQTASIERDGGSTTASIYSPSSPSSAKKVATHTDLSVVASKKSKSKYYHFTWCSGAKQINTANKITFASEQEAIAAGYTLATNCTK